MSSDPTKEFSSATAGSDRQSATVNRDTATTDRAPANEATSGGGTRHEATIVVKGETVHEEDARSSSNQSGTKDRAPAPRREVAEAKVKLQHSLPALHDDADVGVQKEHVVVRDDKADLAFTGTLLASAAPETAPKGNWHEYRIYQTSGGKHVFYKVGRSIFVEDQDTHEAEIFDPAPSSVPSQLLRSARELTRSHPVTWMDAAVDLFGYDPLAKALYRKLGGRFEEHIA
jgi:hypothetical protein